MKEYNKYAVSWEFNGKKHFVPDWFAKNEQEVKDGLNKKVKNLQIILVRATIQPKQ